MGRRRRGSGVLVLVLLVGGCAVALNNQDAEPKHGAGPSSAPARGHRTPAHRQARTQKRAHHPTEHRHPHPHPHRQPRPGGTTRSALLAALGRTRTLPERPFPGGYDRDCGPGHGCVFGTAWTDDTSAPDGHNGCDTRNDVLREQLRHPVLEVGTDGCKVVGGTLHDPYSGQVLDFPAHHQMIQIDHLVPLAYAWDLGAWRWSQQRRERFANDTRVELLAVWGPANESKGDSGPGDWLPINRAFRCTYVLRYLRAVNAYGLAITRADAASIRYTARGCGP